MPPLPPTLSQDFAFASGRTGVLQQLLLSQSDVDRMLGAHDKAEVERILTELKMTNPIDQGLKVAEEILPAIGSWIRAEIESMAPTARRPSFHILWLSEDAQILAYLLKKHHGLISEVASEPASGMTAYDSDALRALVEEGNVSQLPDHIVDFVRRMQKQPMSDPKEIDREVSHWLFALQMRLARASGSSLVQKYVVHRIDLTNLRTALRLKDTEATENVFIPGGVIDTKGLRRDAEAIASSVAKTEYYALADAIRQSADDPNELERALAQVTARDITTMWNQPLTINQLFAFSALAASQLHLLRVLIIGKANGLSPQELKAVLPPFLSASHYLT